MLPDRVVIGAEKEEVFDTLKNYMLHLYLINDRFVLMDVQSSEMTKYVTNALQLKFHF